MFRGELEERFPSCRARLGQITLIEIGRVRLAAGRVSLIGRHGRVAIDQFDALDGNTQLFGDQLSLRGRDSLAELFLAAICGDAAVGGDGDPGVDLIERWRTWRRSSALRVKQSAGCAEADDERARGLQEIAAGESGLF